MTILQSLLLGIIQGITEFLPISSSGHLVLAETALDLEVETLKSFDVALHVGSLLAILIYFRKTIWKILTKDHKYIAYLLVGTIPAVIVGLTLEDKIDEIFRGTMSVGIVMIVTGIYFLIAERKKKPKISDEMASRLPVSQTPKKNSTLNAKRSLLIGLAQMFALIPGVSRSGSTIATGVLLKMERTKAAEFSFLLGSIAITGAGLLTALDVGPSEIAIQPLAVGFLASMLASYFAVKFLMHFFKKHTLKPFAYYLFAIGSIAIILSQA